MKEAFIVGATSEVGNRVVGQLVQKYGHEHITCLVRNTSNTDYLKKFGVRIKIGDVTTPETFRQYLTPQTTYVDMTHPKYYHKSIEAVKGAGIKRAFFVTTTGIYSGYNHCSELYKLGEERIKNSGIVYTILRPSMIYGTERDRNMTKLLRYLARYPVFPVFGTGECLMQPVYVQDLADGICSAIVNEELSRNKEYNLCGPTSLPYLELLQISSQTLAKKVKFLHIPYGLALGIVALAERIPAFPINKEQVQRLLEDKSFDISVAIQDLGFSPRDFRTGIREEIDYLREKRLLPN